jgi:hypothetical protein
MSRGGVRQKVSKVGLAGLLLRKRWIGEDGLVFFSVVVVVVVVIIVVCVCGLDCQTQR